MCVNLWLCFSDGKQVTNKEEKVNIRWSTFTGVLGSEVNGIWEKYTDTNDVNATDCNFTSEVVVTGDDFGLVKLFRFPSLKKGNILLSPLNFIMSTVIDCCLMPIQQLFSYVMARTSKFSMRWWGPLCSRHSDTLFWFRANQSLLFLP